MHLTCALHIRYALDSGADSYEDGLPSTTDHSEDPQVRVVFGTSKFTCMIRKITIKQKHIEIHIIGIYMKKDNVVL